MRLQLGLINRVQVFGRHVVSNRSLYVCIYTCIHVQISGDYKVIPKLTAASFMRASSSFQGHNMPLSVIICKVHASALPTKLLDFLNQSIHTSTLDHDVRGPSPFPNVSKSLSQSVHVEARAMVLPASFDMRIFSMSWEICMKGHNSDLSSEAATVPAWF